VGSAAAICEQQARLFAGAADDNGSSKDVQEEQPVYDASNDGLPHRLHQLIGDPRSGVADDTTQALHGELSVEWLWHQQTNEVHWYRYSIAGRDQLPNMHMDSRLSDHSKNIMYLLRCKDPQR
jgi:hypothetical protein